jgi:hypothetical protein
MCVHVCGGEEVWSVTCSNKCNSMTLLLAPICVLILGRVSSEFSVDLGVPPSSVPMTAP